MAMPERLFVSAKVRCGSKQHTIGVTLKGRLVLCDHDIADFESLKEFLGDGEETRLKYHQEHGSEKLGGVRAIRCFYVLSQWREFMQTGRFYQIPTALRPYLKAVKAIQNQRNNDSFRRGPRWPEYERDLSHRYVVRQAWAKKVGHRLDESPVCFPDGSVWKDSWMQRSKVGRRNLWLVLINDQHVGCVARDPDSPTKLRIIIAPNPQIRLTGERLAPIPLRPAPIRSFYNVAPHRWWDHYREDDK